MTPAFPFTVDSASGIGIPSLFADPIRSISSKPLLVNFRFADNPVIDGDKPCFQESLSTPDERLSLRRHLAVAEEAWHEADSANRCCGTFLRLSSLSVVYRVMAQQVAACNARQ